MRKAIPFVVAGLLILGSVSGCTNTTDPTTTTTQPDPTTSNSTSTSKNNLVGTYNRPYAPYYEVGVPLIEDGHVVYMNFDGFARYYFDAYLADEELSKNSTLKQLMTEGVFFENLENALPSITNPCQNQIISGATSAVTKNVYRYYDKVQNTVIQQERENDSKILPQVTVENGISTVSVAHFLAESYLTNNDPTKMYITTDTTDPAVAGTPLAGSYLDRFNQLIKLVKGESFKTYGMTRTISELPKFIMFYIDDLDALGHNESSHYGVPRATSEVQRMQNVLTRLKEIDDKLGEFVQACKDKNIYNKMTFFLTTDHGMTPFGIQSDNDPVNYGKSKFGELCTAIKTFNNTYNVEMVAADAKPASNTSVVAVGVNLNVLLTWKNGISEAQMQALKAYLMTKDYVGNVLTKAELNEMGFWTEAADMVITPAKYYCFSNQLLATYNVRGQHDSTLDEARRVFGLAWGNKIKDNVIFEEKAFNYDFGVTMAACMGVTLPNANGIVLDIFEQ